MSSDTIAISVKNLSKCYQIYDRPSDRLKQFIFPRLQKLFGVRPRQYFREFWALNDVSFDIKKGETVGIIGRNGGGKSTLLQMVCGTLTPTAGEIQVNGRVAALLELGAGFNPEFSGKDNIFMNGALLGLKEAEIQDRYDAIVAFADIGMFVDQPVKTYSSGMFVRLAFAIAANVEPSILIIDEALAVGDIAFQAKCMSRLRDLMDRGTTILFVSHDLSSVRNICKQVLWLKQGRAVDFGSPKNVVEAYVRDLHLDLNEHTGATPIEFDDDDDDENLDYVVLEKQIIPFSEGYTRYGNGQVEILDVDFIDASGNHIEVIDLHEKFTILVRIKANADIEMPIVGYSLRDLKGNYVIANLSSNYPSMKMPPFKSGEEYIVKIDGVNSLAQGAYTLSIGVEQAVQLNLTHQFLDVLENVRVFRSAFGNKAENIFPGMVWQDVSISARLIGRG